MLPPPPPLAVAEPEATDTDCPPPPAPFWLATFAGVEVALWVCAVELADNPLGPLAAPPPFVAPAAAADNWCWTVVSVPFFGLSGPALACGLPEGSTRTIIAIVLPLTTGSGRND